MVDLSETSNLKEFFEQVRANGQNVHIRFHGLDKNSVEGIVARVADDFVEIRHQYSQFLCPYKAIRLITTKE
ncbi:hypothetical protein ACFL6S_15540 [Candidatus Poribacteria bacterium]